MAARVTEAGKKSSATAEKKRIKAEKMMKANLKNRGEDKDSEGSWESAEEDAPAIRLEELLGNLKLDEDIPESDEEDDDEIPSGSSKKEESKNKHK